MEQPEIIEYEPPDRNESLSLIENDALNDIKMSSKEHPFEMLSFPTAIMDRKCLLSNSNHNFLQHRIKVLKMLDRNIFRLEVALFLKILVEKEDYNIFYDYYRSRKQLLGKSIEGESCLPQTKESPNPQLRLIF